MLPHAVHCLPIYSRCDEIVTALRNHQVAIVAGETGSGKSTVLPLLCREAGFGKNGRIVVTQPRRIAATTLATYVASLDGVPLGTTVGFQIRYRRRVEKLTQIVYMTDGVVVSSLAHNPLLAGYGMIIVDEAHERSVNIDLLLGYLRMLLPKRPDLRCIIASATLDTRLFSRVFGGAQVITVSERRYSIDVRYKPVVELWKGCRLDSYIEGALVALDDIRTAGEQGDVLVFMPTVDDVAEAVRRIRARAGSSGEVVLPLHSRLGAAAQQEVFKRGHCRKIVVATNIAETSLTVPGIRFVIDSGLVRMLRYEPSASVSRMPIEKVSQASADQRAGRCGRVRDGVCIRLFSEQDYLSRPRFTLPEIKRANLAGAILRIAALPWGDPGGFPFLQRPNAGAFAEGFRLLQDLGALDKQHRLTPSGRTMARFPLDPPVACMLLRATDFGAVREVAVIAAALSVKDVLGAADGVSHEPTKFRHPESDFMTLLNVWNQMHDGAGRGSYPDSKTLRAFADTNGFDLLRLREWVDAHRHTLRICHEFPGFFHSSGGAASYEAIHKSLLAGLVGALATRKDSGVYEGVSTAEIRIASASVAARKTFPWLLFHEIVETDRVYGTRAAAIEPKWVEELFGRQCGYRYENPIYDPGAGMVLVNEVVSYRSLTLIRNRVVDCERVDREAACETFIREALAGEKIGEGYRFIAHNREVRDKLRAAERKLRQSYYIGDDALESFYHDRAMVASRRELGELLRRAGGDAFLLIPPERLLSKPLPADFDEYADEIVVAGKRLPVTWKHAQGDPADGATVTVPCTLADILPQYYWEWQLPVFRKARIALLIARLSSPIVGRGLDPADVEERLNELLSIPDGPFPDTALHLIEEQWGITAGSEFFECRAYPDYLWLRVIVVDEHGIIIDAFRPPLSRRAFSPHRDFIVPHRFGEMAAGTSAASGRPVPGEMPLLARREYASAGQLVSCTLWSAYHQEEHGVAVRVFTSRDAALTAHAHAIAHFVEERLAEPLSWAIESVRIPIRLRQAADRCGVTEDLHTVVSRLMVRLATEIPAELPVDESGFEALVADAAKRVAGAAAVILDLLAGTFDALYRAARYIDRQKARYPGSYCAPLFAEFEKDIAAYRTELLSGSSAFRYLLRLSQYLDAVGNRCSAALLDPASYRRAMTEVRECEQLIYNTADCNSHAVMTLRQRLREMVEAYCIDEFSGLRKRSGEAVAGQLLAKERTWFDQALRRIYRE